MVTSDLNLDKNFNEALNLLLEDLSHNHLIEFLESGNLAQRQLAALQIDCIKSEHESDVLMNNLTGQDGKIREVVSLRIKDFAKDYNYCAYFNNSKYCDVFLEAIIDVNGNICRNIIEAVSNFKNNQAFCENFCPKLVANTKKLVNKVKEFDFQDGKYKVNKEVFKLYWCLETIYHFYSFIDFEDLKFILLQTKNIEEYTIREKTAKILSIGFDDVELQSAREVLKNDRNYYVRRF